MNLYETTLILLELRFSTGPTAEQGMRLGRSFSIFFLSCCANILLFDSVASV